MVTTTGVVRAFMAEVRRVAQGDEGKFLLLQRPENQKTRIKLGFTTSVVKQTVLSLTETDYVSGPERDDDANRQSITPGRVMVFGQTINDLDIYIKINLCSGNVICISFHEAEFPLIYPLR